jgi:hypothetical protein
MDKIYNSNVRNLNINLNNIFIKNDDALILVDVEYCLNKKNIFEELFEDLKNLNLLNIFLEDLKNYNLDLYDKI